MAVLTQLPAGRATHRQKCRGWSCLFAFGLFLLTTSASDAQTAPVREYQVKAVFLFNFAQFVHWPPPELTRPQEPLVIGVLGDDPFGSSLDDAVHGEQVNNHPLVIQRYRRVEDIGDCHILFISQSEVGHLEQIFSRLKGRSILTVGDADQFTHRGGMIRFITEKSRIRLRINLEVARACNLTISSKLLRPAEIVSSQEE